MSAANIPIKIEKSIKINEKKVIYDKIGKKLKINKIILIIEIIKNIGIQ